MRCLFLCCFFLIHCVSVAYARKEYTDLYTYQNENPLGKHDGSDGNWLTKDRKNKTQVWDAANQKNLQLINGYEAYQTLAERAAFYHWFDQKTKKQGFTTQWAKLACSTTKRLNCLTNGISVIVGYSNLEIRKFIAQGNQLIFDDCWPELSKLILSAPITGEMAKKWDGKILKREQELIHPYYLQLKKKSLQKLERLLKKESFPMQFFSGCEFEGSILSIHDVYVYGMKRMGY